jgi:GTP-binding protein
LLTKADKLGRGQQGNALQAVKKELFSAFGDTVSVQTFSAESTQGVDEARMIVGNWLAV